MISGYTILCDSNIPWSHNRYSKHHLMAQFARCNTVFFVNPPRTCATGLPVLYSRLLRKSSNRLTQLPDGDLRVFTPLQLPLKSKLDFINRIDPWFHAAQLRALVKSADPRRLVLFLGNAWNTHLLEAFGNAACTIYHCSDNFSAMFSGAFRDKVVNRETWMLSHVDMAIAVSKQTLEHSQRYARRAYMINHGVDPAFLYREDDREGVPADLSAIEKVRAGYIGGIDAQKDFDLIEHVVLHNEDVQFVFAGPVDEAVRERFASIRRIANVTWIGPKPHHQLSAYVKNFDVCIMPYARNDWTSAISCPLKLVEYLAAGKPVVGSGIVLDSRLRSGVWMASSAEEFSRALRLAIAASRSPGMAARISGLVREWTWERRAQELSELIEQHLAAPGRAIKISRSQK
jgi:glycosyltransferase involved in cell wall biosynthesis